MKNLKDYIRLGIHDNNKKWIFVVIKPGFQKYSKEIIKRFEKSGWLLTKMRPKQLLLSEAKELYRVHSKEDFYKSLCEYMSSDISTGIIFTKSSKMSDKVFDSVDKIKDEIRNKYGESDMKNVLHSSDSLDNMKRESSIYF